MKNANMSNAMRFSDSDLNARPADFKFVFKFIIKPPCGSSQQVLRIRLEEHGYR